MRILRILVRLLECFPKFFLYTSEFGAETAMWMCWAYLFPSLKGKRYINGICKYFEKELKALVVQYQNNSREVVCKQGKILWCCWLGGEEMMPDIVKICYQAMRENVPCEVSVVLITKRNYSDYIDLPKEIEEKFQEGVISPAHFSDVIRFTLLSKYGGMWLDATVYTSGTIPKEYFEMEYYTQKVANPDAYPKEPSRAQWCGFIWAGASNNKLFCFVRDALYQYWCKHTTVVDYIFFDYIILVAYQTMADVKKMIDSQIPNNERIWDLWNSIDEPYDEEKYKEISAHNLFHKLTYKGCHAPCTPDGVITTYGWLMGGKK